MSRTVINIIVQRSNLTVVRSSETTNDCPGRPESFYLVCPLDNPAQELATLQNVCARNKSLNSVPISIAEISGAPLKRFKIIFKAK